MTLLFSASYRSGPRPPSCTERALPSSRPTIIPGHNHRGAACLDASRRAEGRLRRVVRRELQAFAPSQAKDEGKKRWWRRWVRASASPG